MLFSFLLGILVWNNLHHNLHPTDHINNHKNIYWLVYHWWVVSMIFLRVKCPYQNTRQKWKSIGTINWSLWELVFVLFPLPKRFAVSCRTRQNAPRQFSYTMFDSFRGLLFVAEWLRTLIFSALNRSSSHRCAFEPSSGHVTQANFCLWVVRLLFSWISHFRPTVQLTQLKMSEIIFTGP